VGNGDDVTEKYIFLTTSHDGSGSITAAFTLGLFAKIPKHLFNMVM
jgi:hypothetical protein